MYWTLQRERERRALNRVIEQMRLQYEDLEHALNEE